MNPKLKAFFKFLLFLSVGVGILYFVYQNQEANYQMECQCTGKCEFDSLAQKIFFDFKSANPFWLGMICLAFMVSNLSRAMRWNLLIEPLGYKPRTFNTFFATMIGYLVNLALPRAGELAKPAAVNRYEKIPLDKLLGTIVVDRIFDVIMLLVVVALTFLLQFSNLWNFLFGAGSGVEVQECIDPNVVASQGSGIPWKMLFFVAIGIGLFTLVVIAWQWKRVKETALFKKVWGLWLNFGEGLKTVFKLRSPMQFFAHTLLIWFMYYLMMYLCFFAYGPTSGLSPLAALLAFVFGTFGIVIPSPGGMGTYQIAVTAALFIYGIPQADGFAFANIIFFTINIFCNIFFGFLAYILLPIYNRNYEPDLPKDAA